MYHNIKVEIIFWDLENVNTRHHYVFFLTLCAMDVISNTKHYSLQTPRIVNFVYSW